MKIGFCKKSIPLKSINGGPKKVQWSWKKIEKLISGGGGRLFAT